MAIQDEEYILKWNDHKTNFFSLMSEDLFQQELLTDLTICCGDSLFKAHRLVLSVCSPHFRHMLTNAPAGHHPIIFLNNVHPADFERLLQFMYYGEVRIPNGDLEPLLRTASSLKIKGLTTQLTQEVPTLYSRRTSPLPAPKDPPLKKRRISSENDEKPRTSGSSPLTQHNNKHSFSYESVNLSTSYRPEAPRTPPPPQSVTPTSQLPPQPAPIPLTTKLAVSEARLQPIVTLKRQQPHGESYRCLPHHRRLKEESTEDGPLSPSTGGGGESVPSLVGPHPLQRKRIVPSSSGQSLNQPVPRVETRIAGTCFFCSKSFMKNKQLMNHVCPKKPKYSTSNTSTTASSVVPQMVSALAMLTRK